jgi:hypothetical protein
MIAFAIYAPITGAIACLVFAGLCIRPALRFRALALRLANHPSMIAVAAASDSFESFNAAGAQLAEASRRFESAAVSVNSAALSIGAYASQVSVMAVIVDGLLELFVPRLRGMIRDP